MGRLTTHVLDTALGQPAAGLVDRSLPARRRRRRSSGRRRPMPTGGSIGPLLEGRTSCPASTNSVPCRRLSPRAGGAARSAVPRRDPDPVRDRDGGRALPRAPAALALRLQHLSRKLTDPMRNTIRFIRKGRMVELTDIEPTTMLLDYLREIEGAKGTKEGCREGDCGACTVAIGRLRDGRAGLRAGQCLHPASRADRRLRDRHRRGPRR